MKMDDNKFDNNHTRMERRAILQKKRQFRGIFWFMVPILIILIISVITYYSFSNPVKQDKKNKSKAVKTTTTVAPKASQGPEPEPSKTETITITAGGDVIFDRKVRDLINTSGGEAPLADVASYFTKADISIINLESPVSNRGTRKAEKDVTFRGDPAGIESLAAAEIDFSSLANNHALDYGVDAIDDTIMLLRENDIQYTGAGLNIGEAQRLALKKLDNGLIVGFMAYSYIIPPGFMATESKEGIAGLRPEYYASLIERIKEARKQVDYLIIHFHWGMEYEDYPLAYQKELGRMVIDAGVDLVLAEHPHVIQGIEVYKNKLIAYSLGDFVFDHRSRKTGEAFILEMTYTKKGVEKAVITPVYLTAQGKPQVVKGAEAQSILNRLQEISNPFEAKFDIVDDIAYLRLQ